MKRHFVITAAMVAAVSLFVPAGIAQTPPLARVQRDQVALLHTAQLLPVDSKGEVVALGDLEKQFQTICESLAEVLHRSSELQGLLKLNVYVAKPSDVQKVQELLIRKFDGKHAISHPAITVIASALSRADALVALDAVASAFEGAGTSVTRSMVTPYATNFARVALLPTNGVVYISGQADKGDVAATTRGTLQKLQSSLEFLGLTKEDVVQCKAYIRTAADAETAKKEFEKFFSGQTVPPLVFVDWISKDPVIEIETIAACKPGATNKEPIEYLTPPDVKPSPVYAKIVRVNKGDLIYFSGFMGKSSNNAAAEIEEIFADLTTVARDANSDLTHLAKATYYVSNNQTSGKLNELRPKYFDPKRPPAASKAMIKDAGFAGKGIVIDMIGVSK